MSLYLNYARHLYPQQIRFGNGVKGRWRLQPNLYYVRGGAFLGGLRAVLLAVPLEVVMYCRKT